jgi:hypothetical protein
MQCSYEMVLRLVGLMVSSLDQIRSSRFKFGEGTQTNLSHPWTRCLFVRTCTSKPSLPSRRLQSICTSHCCRDMTSTTRVLRGSDLQQYCINLPNVSGRGNIPLDVRHVFYGAALCALAKKDGAIRSIAYGSTLRRLVAKAAFRLLNMPSLRRLLRHSSGLELRMV